MTGAATRARYIPRREFLQRSAGIALVAAGGPALLAACVGQGQGGGTVVPNVTGAFDWKRYSGQEITVLLNEHPWTTRLQARIGEFEDLTGIQVSIQTFAEDLYFDKMEQALRSAVPVADVFMESMDSSAYDQYRASLLTTLTPLINNTSATAPGYDFKDFPATLESVVSYPPNSASAQVYGVAISVETYILFYNKSLVDQYLDGRVPPTMDELIDAAQKITAQGQGKVFGAVMRGIRSDTIMDGVTSVVYNSWGSQPTPLPYNVWFDGAWSMPRLTDPRIVDGLTHYAGLLAAGPSNALALDWPDAVTLFAQGKAAFYIDASVFAPTFEDPKQSQIAGQVGYALMPQTDQGQLSGQFSWGLGIPSNASNKEAAWYLIQWATSKENTAALGTNTWGATRLSVYDDPSYVDSLNPQFAQVVGKAIQTARATVVMRSRWKQGALAIVDAIQEVAQGSNAEAAIQAANDELAALYR